MRFSIRTLLAWTILFAIGFMALREAGQFSLGIVFTLTVQLFLFAAYLACRRRGSARAFWIAFCVAGLAYAVAALGPWLSSTPAGPTYNTIWATSGSIRLGLASNPQVKSRMPTTPALERLAEWIERSKTAAPDNQWNQAVRQWYAIWKLDDPKEAFLQTGHLILSWVAGLLGGTLAALVISLRGQRKKTAEEADAGATVA